MDRLGKLSWLYEAAVLAWIIFGLGYVFMIIGFITESLRAPAKKAKKWVKQKASEKAIISRILQEIVLLKSKVSLRKILWPH